MAASRMMTIETRINFSDLLTSHCSVIGGLKLSLLSSALALRLRHTPETGCSTFPQLASGDLDPGSFSLGREPPFVYTKRCRTPVREITPHNLDPS
jgi:hypothetical protein